MSAGEASDTPALELRGVSRSYVQGGARLDVFREVSLALAPGEVVALVGPSDAGEVVLAGQSAAAMPDHARSRLRRLTIGFIYQFHHLLPEFSALENVVIPQLIAGAGRGAARARAAALLGGFGLGARVGHRPGELSGGEQQRVAIARALANRPRVLLADEPTGNLDPATAGGVFSDLVEMSRAEGLAALIATHNHALAKAMDRTLTLVDGTIRKVEAGG